MKIRARLVSAVALGIAASGAPAKANVAVNGSFEDATNFVPTGQNAMSLLPGSTVMPAWTVISNELAWIMDPNPFGVSANDGVFFLDLTGYHDSAPFGGVAQSLNTFASHRYRVSFDLGSSDGASRPTGVQVTAGNTVQSFLSASLGQSAWDNFTLDFDSTDTSTLLSFVGTQASIYIGLDNVVVTDLGRIGPAVPEPASWALMIAGFGLAGAAVRRRRLVIA